MKQVDERGNDYIKAKGLNYWKRNNESGIFLNKAQQSFLKSVVVVRLFDPFYSVGLGFLIFSIVIVDKIIY